MEQCSETSAYKIQTPGNYPEESIQHSEHGENMKSRKCTTDQRFMTLLFIPLLLHVPTCNLAGSDYKLLEDDAIASKHVGAA